VNFGLKVTQYNFRGRAERLRITAQTGFEDRLLLNYRIPYIDKKQQLGIMPEFLLINSRNLGYVTSDHLRTFLTSDDDLLRSFGASMWTTLRKKYLEYHNFGVGYARVWVADTITVLNPDYLGEGKQNQRSLTLAYAYQHNRRDNVNYPLTGYNLYAEMSKTGLGVFNDLDYFSLLGSASKYWNLGNQFYFANRVVGYRRFGDHPLHNFNGLGFEDLYNVRGYELDLIETPAYLLYKSAARKLLFQRKANLGKFIKMKQFQTFPIAVYGKVFFDGAYNWNYPGYENNNRLTDTFIYGTGFGLDLVLIYDVVIRMEYSFNADGEAQFFLNFERDI